MAFGVASVVLQESCRIRCTAEDFGSVPGTDSPCPLTDHYKRGPDRGMRFGRGALFDQMAH
jgi:hypothetical protein